MDASLASVAAQFLHQAGTLAARSAIPLMSCNEPAAGGTWSGTVYQPPGKYDAMAGDEAAHEAAITMFTPEAFPGSWVPLMAQQMAGVKPSRWELWGRVMLSSL
jgi:hypothetical protein